MKMLRLMAGVKLVDRKRNDEIREMLGVERVGSVIDRSRLTCLATMVWPRGSQKRRNGARDNGGRKKNMKQRDPAKNLTSIDVRWTSRNVCRSRTSI